MCLASLPDGFFAFLDYFCSGGTGGGFAFAGCGFGDFTQGGAGSENLMGGLAQAFGDNVPILYLPGGPALAEHSVRPSFSPVRTYHGATRN